MIKVVDLLKRREIISSKFADIRLGYLRKLKEVEVR